MDIMTYSIIQMNTNNYDKTFDCLDDDAHRKILFTDVNRQVRNWEQRKVTTNSEYPFDSVFKVRWNPFNFTDTDYSIWLDGSIKVTGSLKKYIELMVKSGADFATLKHPFRDNIFAEYFEWCRIRNYDKNRAFQWMYHMMQNGWNPKNKGLYQVTVCIFKNTKRIREFGEAVIKELHTFNGEHLERLDQTVITYLLMTRFRDIKVLELSENMYKFGPALKLIWDHPAK